MRMLILGGVLVRIRSVAEHLGLPLSGGKKRRRQLDFASVPVRDSGKVPRAVFRLARSDDMRLGAAAQADGIFPDHRNIRHELEALHVLLVLRGRIAQHLERRLVERHERHLVAARPDRTGMLAVAAIVADLVVVHRARRIVHGACCHADEETCHVVVAHVLPFLGPLHLLKPVDALEREDIRISALEAHRAIHAMIVQDHLVLRAGRSELLEEVCDLRISAIHEIYLEALCAKLREVFGDLLFLSVDLSPRHPENDPYALLVRIVDKVGNVDFRAVLPDVELGAPAFIEDYILNAVLRGKVDETDVGLGVAAIAVVEVVPPFPRHLARLDPGEVGVLRGRRRERIENIRLAKLGRGIGEREGAIGEHARRIGLGDEVLRICDLHPAATRLKPPFLAPAANALCRLRILGEKRLELRAAIGRLHIAEVPDGIVVKIRIDNRYSRAFSSGGVDERKKERLLGIGFERRHIGKLGNLPLAAERSALGAVEPATNAFGKRNVGLLAIYDARLFRLEAVGYAIVARGKTDRPFAKVHQGFIPGKIDPALLVDRRRRKAAELLWLYGARLPDAFLHALAVHLKSNFGLGYNDRPITNNLVGERIGIEANLVLAVGGDGRVHIGIECCAMQAAGQDQDSRSRGDGRYLHEFSFFVLHSNIIAYCVRKHTGDIDRVTPRGEAYELLYLPDDYHHAV